MTEQKQFNVNVHLAVFTQGGFVLLQGDEIPKRALNGTYDSLSVAKHILQDVLGVSPNWPEYRLKQVGCLELDRDYIDIVYVLFVPTPIQLGIDYDWVLMKNVKQVEIMRFALTF